MSQDPNNENEPLEIKGATPITSLRGPRAIGHIILWATLIFIAIAIVWAYYGQLDVVTVAEGKVIPSKQIQKVQNLEGGIVKSVLVKEGQSVEKDQILMYLEQTQSYSAFREGEIQALNLKIKIARLEAEVNNKPFHLDPDLKGKAPLNSIFPFISVLPK